MQTAERAGDDLAVNLTRGVLSQALLHSNSPDRDQVLTVAAPVLDTALDERFSLLAVPISNAITAWVKGRHTDRGGALSALRAAANQLFNWGSLPWCIPATRWLVESLLNDPEVADVQEAQAALDRLATARPTTGSWRATSCCCGFGRC